MSPKDGAAKFGAKTPKDVLEICKDNDLKMVDVKFVDMPGAAWCGVIKNWRPKIPAGSGGDRQCTQLAGIQFQQVRAGLS